jgi:hypothetical protein
MKYSKKCSSIMQSKCGYHTWQLCDFYHFFQNSKQKERISISHNTW